MAGQSPANAAAEKDPGQAFTRQSRAGQRRIDLTPCLVMFLKDPPERPALTTAPDELQQ